MTDAEIRDVGQKFIDSRRELLSKNPCALDPATIELALQRWRFIDPLRMGIYVLAKEPQGIWSVDMDHVEHLCTNAAAFAEKRPNSARVAAFVADDEWTDF